MVATIQQIIGKVNPKLYAENGKELLKKYGSSDNIPADEVKAQAITFIPGDMPKYFVGNKKGTEASHNLVYDSSSETLEPVYFFILDLMNDYGLSIEKLVDNFSPSPGSGYFSELGQRATIMQQQGTKILGDVNTVLRSVLNIIYDLKEFRIRLQHYNDRDSKDKDKMEASLLALKQIWMDKVDIAKGNSSIKAMALGQVGFQTLIDAFLVAKDEKDISKLDLNDRVRRILLPRISEFNLWLRESERELRKRYELEKTYLKSQVNSLKLYARWAKPYLKAAHELEMKEVGREPALVKAFNTILLELTLLGKSKIDAKDAAIHGELPADFQKLKTKRDYYSCILVQFKFRSIPQRIAGQTPHYVFGGKAEVSFIAYALNEDELKKLDEEIEKADVEDVLALIEGATTESLGSLQEEINFFLEETEDEESLKSKEGSNPFMALIGAYNKKEEKRKTETESKPGKIVVRSDDFIEKEHLRTYAANKAIESIFNLFDVYKKAHGMVSYT